MIETLIRSQLNLKTAKGENNAKISRQTRRDKRGGKQAFHVFEGSNKKGNNKKPAEVCLLRRKSLKGIEDAHQVRVDTHIDEGCEAGRIG